MLEVSDVSVGAARSAWPRVQGRGLHPREWRSAKPRPGVQPETGGERGMPDPGSATARGRESQRCASASRGAASPPILGLAKLSFGGWQGAVPKWDMRSPTLREQEGAGIGGLLEAHAAAGDSPVKLRVSRTLLRPRQESLGSGVPTRASGMFAGCPRATHPTAPFTRWAARGALRTRPGLSSARPVQRPLRTTAPAGEPLPARAVAPGGSAEPAGVPGKLGVCGRLPGRGQGPVGGQFGSSALASSARHRMEMRS